MSSTAVNLFYDTSALVTYWYDEPGSDHVELVTVLLHHADESGAGNCPMRSPTRLL
jgi:hypothetical protein